MASEETIDIVDENNNIIGSADAESAHNNKLLHRIVGVFVFNAEGSLYVQSGNKYGRLDISVGGHVQQGESYEHAAQREMSKELRIAAPLKHLSTFFPKDTRRGHYWALYTTTAPSDWKFQETEEVKSLQTMEVAKIVAMMQSNPDAFTHGFINAMNEFVRIKR